MAQLALKVDKNPLDHALSLLPGWVAEAMTPLSSAERERVEEIRICQDKPLMVRGDRRDWFVGRRGLSASPAGAWAVSPRHVVEVLDAVTSSSVYALEDAMRAGFLPLAGGHRVGLAGEARLDGGEVRGFRHVTGFNVRINRAVSGVARAVVPSLRKPGETVWSTLVLSPPGAGKTTLLRDMIRTLAWGDPGAGLRPHRVGVADERHELGGGVRGVPQLDLGPRTDVIDGCPKRFALPMLVRAMAPEVVATDEVGHPQDAEAVLDAVGAGVTLLCTAHAASLDEAAARPSLRPLLAQGVFQRFVVLSRRNGPGTVERVVKGGGAR